MIKKLHLILFFLIGIISCSNYDEEFVRETPFLKVEKGAVNFEETAQTYKIAVQTNGKCEIQIDDDWCSAKQISGNLEVSVGDNPDKDVRRTKITLILRQYKAVIDVAQLGWGKALLIATNKAEVSASGGEVTAEITTNIPYKYSIDAEWVKEIPSTRNAAHPVVTSTHHFRISGNAGDQRFATITFTEDTETESSFEPVTLTIKQNGLDDYQPGNLDDIKNDIQVKVSGGNASSFQSGEGIENSFDGDRTTIYHSSWNNKSDNYFPITLEYYFDSSSVMDYFVYYPRATGGNGHFKDVDISVRTSATTRGTEEWQFVMNFDFKGNSSATRVDFPTPLIGVSAVRFTVKSGTGDGQGFAACSEMEFYKKNPENFDWSTLFTDPSCSELKPGVVESDIQECAYSLYRNIAFYLFHQRYPREFRIADFKAYPHPDAQAQSHLTNPYSLLDNPTGIAVEKGEELVVMADLQGQRVSIRVQNLDKPGGDGFGGDTYPLTTGANRLKMQNKGLVYVMYHTPDFRSLPPVKLHFVNGTVNGYYDSQNPHLAERAEELLGKATNKYFDVVGKWAHLTFPTNRFRNHTSDLRKLINLYDKLVYSEQELMGLVKYKKTFQNRMYFNVMYHSYMYATAYHTGYHDDTLAELCNDKTFTNNVWGPAHEVGHCNQTRPGLMWLGMTEVTNNIMSEYIQTTIFGMPSRVQVEDMGSAVASNRYAKAWNGILVDSLSHAAHNDVFCKLIPLWQLELYFGKVKGLTPLRQEDKGGFYPDVYEYIRTHESPNTAGEQQLEFVYIASLCARMNLLDFFEKWGFLKEVDIELDDYGKGRITVTKELAEQVRKRVEDLKLPKPDVPVEYISDNNYSYFKEAASITKGTAMRSGNILTMDNWKNVIAYEVRDGSAEGTLIQVSEGVKASSAQASFEVREGWKDNYKVYAVQYDNQRIEVRF